MPGEYTADLRSLATAIDTLDSAKSFSPGDVEMTEGAAVFVTWQWGASTPGYRELADAMSKVASRHWLQMRAEAIKDLEAKVKIEQERVARHEHTAGAKA